jgi:hypothetical protein
MRFYIKGIGKEQPIRRCREDERRIVIREPY